MCKQDLCMRARNNQQNLCEFKQQFALSLFRYLSILTMRWSCLTEARKDSVYNHTSKILKALRWWQLHDYKWKPIVGFSPTLKHSSPWNDFQDGSSNTDHTTSATYFGTPIPPGNAFAYQKCANGDISHHYNSNKPGSHKHNCVNTLIRIGATRCSDAETRRLV